jgi:hypothetical protein
VFATALSAQESVSLFYNWNKSVVAGGPAKATRFTLKKSSLITSIMNYHWNNAGGAPGTVGLQASDGSVYGPWQAEASDGTWGAKNVNWTVTPNVTLPAGTYTVLDSDLSTWSHNPESSGRGFTAIQGRPSKGGAAERGGRSQGSFAGVWETNFSKMTLSQQGNHVSGSYEHMGGRIEGTVTNGVLKGTWTQNGGWAGAFVFKLASGGASFSGTWGYKEENSSGGEWKGKRLQEGLADSGGDTTPSPQQPNTPWHPSDFAGAWDTDFNRMQLSQSGNTVTGTYKYLDGRIEATQSGKTLRGRWIQNNAQGGFVFTLSPDGRSFSGTWGKNEAESGSGGWSGKRAD